MYFFIYLQIVFIVIHSVIHSFLVYLCGLYGFWDKFVEKTVDNFKKKIGIFQQKHL